MSTGRRSGPASPSSRPDASCSPAPRPAMTESPHSSSTWTRRASPIRPLRTMHGVDEFCEVYYDDVVIPASRMLGKPGDGWRLAMDLLPYERSTCFWQRIAYLYSRFDELIKETRGVPDTTVTTNSSLAQPISRCTRCAAGPGSPNTGCATERDSGRTPPSTRCCWRRPSSGSTTPSATCCPGHRARRDPWRSEYLYSRAATIYGGTAEIQRNIIARRLLDLGKE